MATDWLSIRVGGDGGTLCKDRHVSSTVSMYDGCSVSSLSACMLCFQYIGVYTGCCVISLSACMLCDLYIGVYAV